MSHRSACELGGHARRLAPAAYVPAPMPRSAWPCSTSSSPEDLYDHDFVDKWCYGFDQLAERVRDMPAGEGRRRSPAASMPSLIREPPRARVATTSKPASDRLGPGHRPRTSNGVQAGHCVFGARAAITGRHRRAGRCDAHRARLVNERAGATASAGTTWARHAAGARSWASRSTRAYVGLVLNAQCDDGARMRWRPASRIAFKMGWLRGHELPRRHLRRAAQALARRHGEEPGVVLRASTCG